MGIHGCLSLKRTVSDANIYDRKYRNLWTSKLKFKHRKARKTSSVKEKYSSHPLQDKLPQKYTAALDEILNEYSSDDSIQDFEDFIKSISRKESSKSKKLNLSSRKILSNVLTYSLDLLQYDQNGSSDEIGMYNYRSGSSSSRNNPTSFHPCDFYKKSKVQKRDGKPFPHTNYCFDSSSKYRSNRPRSVSPNLPKIPYLEKPPQQTYLTASTQRKPRLIFKTRLCKDNHRLSKNASKKSIPDHALMKNLLSGLSIFDNDDEINRSNSKNIHKYKSMGNIKSLTTGNCALKGSCKSSVDFRESTVQNSLETTDNLKDYYNNHKQVNIEECLNDDKPNCYQVNYSCVDAQECINSGTNDNFTRERRDNNWNCQVVSKENSQRRSTLVERRRNFFENRKRQLELESVKPRPTTLVINCVQKQIQNDFHKPDEITEIYRNFRGVQSTSTLSKRSSSLPPMTRLRNCSGKNGELFNPDYNFCCPSNSGSGSFKNSIIETIRSKVFQRNNFAKQDLDDDWKPEPIYLPKFPKETRTAMSIILSNKNSSAISCKLCREKLHKRQLAHIHTQTSPQVSKSNIPESSGNTSNSPCPKNLLCQKGYHSGKCAESARRKLVVVCDEHCACRENRRMFECGDMSIWPGQAVRLLDDDKRNTKDYSESPEDFLVLIRPDLEPSEERIDNRQNETSPGHTLVTMNGLNGHTNGDFNGCGDIITQNQQRGCWTIGLINSKYRYLTAETFGFKINANGASLKKKQIWTLEPDTSSGSETCVYLKSHLDKYLAVDSFGNVTCESEEKEAGSKFQVTVSEDNTGHWAFRNVVRGYFLGSSSDKLTCTAKAPGDSEYWHIHLAARPQMNLRSVGRKRFAHLSENLDEIHVDANIPWGEDTLFTLEFRADEDGKYALHTCNNKYLSNGGKLVDTCNKDCLFSAEYHSGQLALRDRNGQYLSPIGSKAVLKTRSNTVTKDELFSLEDSLPQASFVAALNSRYVSVKQGVDVTANQDEISSHETFQLEFDWSTKRWYIRTMQDKYWTLETGGGIQASGDKRSSNALFDLVWQGDGSLAFRANNGRYVITKRSGHLYATSDVIDENCKYYFYLINRPILVLKCEQGFVGYKSASSPKLECNKATYECIQVERAEKGIIYFKDHAGKYWHVDSESITADSDTPEGFYLELREPTRLCIKTTSGNYLTASKNGLFRMGDSSIENATQWEY